VPSLTPGLARWVFAALLFLLIGAAYFDYLTYGRLFLFTDAGGDTVNAQYPHLVHIADYLRHDGIPRWSFEQGMGQNVFPDSLGDPFRLLLYLAGRDLIPYAIVWVEVLKLALGGWLFFLYLRLLGLAPPATVAGGLLYAFCGYAVLGGTWYTFTLETVYLALLLYAFERHLLLGRSLALPVAFALLAAGRPFAVYTTGLVLLVYGTYRYVTVRGWAPRAYLGFMARLGGLAALGVAMGAFQFLPGVLEMLQSARVVGVGAAFGGLATAAPFRLESASHYTTAVLRLFSNDLLGTGSDFQGWRNYLEAPVFYCGLATLLLAPQALPHLTPRRRGAVLAVAAGFVLAVVFPYLRHALWLFTGDYYRFFGLAAALFLILGAARGLDRILVTGKVNLPLLGGTAAVLLALLFYPYDPARTPVHSGLRAACGVLLVAYSALLWMLGRRTLGRPAAAALVVLIAVELGGFAHVTVERRVAMTPAQLHGRTGYNDLSKDAVRRLHARDRGWYRIFKTFGSGPGADMSLNDGLVQGFRGTASYHRFNQPAYTAFLVEMGMLPERLHTTRWLPGPWNRPLVAALTSVKYEISRGARPAPLDADAYLPLARLDDVEVYANRLFLPLGTTYDRALPRAAFDALPPEEKDRALLAAFVPEPGAEAAAGRFPLLEKPPDPADVPALVAARRRAALAITAQGENRIRGTVTLAEPRLMFFSIPFDAGPFHSGWSARVDGRPARLLRVDVGFTGLPLEPGAHTVELTYRPPLMVEGGVVSLLSLLIYGAWAVRRRRAARGASAGAGSGA